MTPLLPSILYFQKADPTLQEQPYCAFSSHFLLFFSFIFLSKNISSKNFYLNVDKNSSEEGNVYGVFPRTPESDFPGLLHSLTLPVCFSSVTAGSDYGSGSPLSITASKKHAETEKEG